MKSDKKLERKLHDICMAMMELEDAKIEEEMKNAEPHVFSKEFESKMDALIQSMDSKKALGKAKGGKKKSKEEEESEPRPIYSCKIKYMAAAIVAVCCITGFLFFNGKNAVASQNSLRIKEWMEDFFVVEEKSEKKEGVLFEESRIGYMPEGFEKVEESVFYSRVYYKFQNNTGNYIMIKVYQDKIEAAIDNSEMQKDILLNKAGYEYQYGYKESIDEHIFVWIDIKGVYYQVQSIFDKDEIIKVMDGISY